MNGRPVRRRAGWRGPPVSYLDQLDGRTRAAKLARQHARMLEAEIERRYDREPTCVEQLLIERVAHLATREDREAVTAVATCLSTLGLVGGNHAL